LAEKELRTLETAMADPAVAADHRKMQEACRRFSEAQAALAALYDRWSELGSRA